MLLLHDAIPLITCLFPLIIPLKIPYNFSIIHVYIPRIHLFNFSSFLSIGIKERWGGSIIKIFYINICIYSIKY